MEQRLARGSAASTTLAPGDEVTLEVLSGALAGRHRAAVVGSNRHWLYLCVAAPRGNGALPPDTGVRVFFDAGDGTRRSFETRTAKAGQDRGGCWAVPWPRAIARRERRRHLRQDVVLPVVVEQLPSRDQAAVAAAARFPGLVCDLSEGGALLRCAALRAAEGELLRLTIHFPGRRTHEVWGEVRWVKDGAVGLQFLELSAELGDAVRQVIEARRAHLSRALAARLRGISPEDVWPRRVEG